MNEKDRKSFLQAILERLISFIYCENPNSQDQPTTQEPTS